MQEKGIAILIMLAFVGVGMAFAFVGLMVSETGTSHEDVWMYQKPVKEEFKSLPMLTEEEKKEAREIALSDPKAKDFIEGKNYGMKISGITELRMNETGEAEAELGGASVTFRFEDGTIYFVHVDLEKGKVIRISPPIAPPETSGKKVDE